MPRSIKDLKPAPGRFYNGYYKPTNLKKYIGDPLKIIYRSSWERAFCKFCDNSDLVEKWSSEPFPIKYYSPIDKLIHEYNIDFYMRFVHDNGQIESYLVEIKPKHKLQKPVPPQKATTRLIGMYNEQCKEYIINCAKFSAAKAFAAKVGYKFIVVTEDFLFGAGYKTDTPKNPEHAAYLRVWSKKYRAKKKAEKVNDKS